MILFVFMMCSLHEKSNAHQVMQWIESTKLTNWGDWSSEIFCPDGSFVSSMNLKIENNQGGNGDDTALNGIQLFCTNLEGQETKTLTTDDGPWGFFRGRTYCNYGGYTGYVVGMQLKSDPNQGSKDDAGAVNLKLACLNYDTTHTDIMGFDLPFGEWTYWQECPINTAVCGMKTQVETKQGGNDDTTLNNVNLACCKVPHPADTCVPVRKWKTIIACHAGITDCVMSFSSGLVTYHEQSTSISSSIRFYESFGTTVSAGLATELIEAKLEQHSEVGQEIINGRTLTTIVSETNSVQQSWSFKVSCVGSAQELVVACGPYEIGTREYRCVPDV